MKPIPSKYRNWSELNLYEQDKIRLLGNTLTIRQIGEFMYDTDKERNALYRSLVEACETKRIKYRGDITNWKIKYELLDCSDHYLDYTKSQERIDTFLNLAETDKYRVTYPPNCKIHRDDLKRYLPTIDLWPVENCLLANWWTESKNIQPVLVDDSALTLAQDCTISDELSVWEVAIHLAFETRRMPSAILKKLAYSGLQWMQISHASEETHTRLNPQELKQLRAAYEKSNSYSL